MNNTKERPIALTVQEVNAVLAGDKTQHRVPVLTAKEIDEGFEWDFSAEGDSAVCIKEIDDERQEVLLKPCPFGAIGDRLCVQEEHRPTGWSFDDGDVRIQYKDGKDSLCEIQTWEEVESNPNDDYLIAICDELINRDVPIKEGTDCFDMEDESNLPHWRSANVMPKFASRALLEITDIRIERLNDISEQDAIAQGIKHIHADPKDRVGPNHFTKSNGWYQCSRPTAAEVFKEMYKVSDDYEKYGENPWVWVIEFKTIESSEVQGG